MFANNGNGGTTEMRTGGISGTFSNLDAQNNVFNENGVELMKEQEWLDAIILDFTTDDTLKYLEGQ